MERYLSLEETEACLKAWQECKDEDAFNLLFSSNGGRIQFMAKKYKGRGLSYDELISAGNLGLFNAVSHFDYVNGDVKSFSIYLYTAIKNTILQELRNHKKTENILSLDQPYKYDEEGNEMKVEDSIGTEKDEYVEMALARIQTESIQAIWMQMLTCLTPKEREIMQLRYGIEKNTYRTQVEVSKLLGCTRQAVSSLEQRALVKIRKLPERERLKDF